MKDVEYLSERLEGQIKWYSRKSRRNKSFYISSRLVEIFSAVIIPFLSGFSDKVPYFEWGVAILGVLIAISAAASSLFNSHENWIKYRNITEQLKNVKYLYVTGVEPYNSDDKFSKLVTKVESLISKENTYWANAHKKNITNKSS